MTKAIYFDMDGTIYDLYGVENWLPRLHAEDPTAYCEGCPLADMEHLNDLMEAFQGLGYIIGVITWTAKGGSADYNKAVRKVKREWIKENLPCVQEFHCVKYGTPKHKVAKVKDSMLVDDNKEVRDAWVNGRSIDPNDMIRIFEKMLDKFC